MGTASVLTNVRILHGSVDLTGQSNQAEFPAEFDVKDRTVFGPAGIGSAGWKEVIAGLGSGAPKASGFWAAGDASQVDDHLWSTLGNENPLSMAAHSDNGLMTYGDPVFLANVVDAKYMFGGSPG